MEMKDKMNISCPETIRRYCEGSLRHLGVDSFALFYQHRFDPKVPVEDVVGTITNLIKEGKVRRWAGCCKKPRGLFLFQERRNCRIWKRTCIRSTFPCLPMNGDGWKKPWRRSPS